MTRKDFQFIADVLKNHAVNGGASDAIALDFAVALQKLNPRFDVQRFVKACMPNIP